MTVKDLTPKMQANVDQVRKARKAGAETMAQIAEKAGLSLGAVAG